VDFDARNQWHCPHSAGAKKVEIHEELNQFLVSKDNEKVRDVNREIGIKFDRTTLKKFLKQRTQHCRIKTINVKFMESFSPGPRNIKGEPSNLYRAAPVIVLV
jgi:hypothetical protein